MGSTILFLGMYHQNILLSSGFLGPNFQTQWAWRQWIKDLLKHRWVGFAPGISSVKRERMAESMNKIQYKQGIQSSQSNLICKQFQSIVLIFNNQGMQAYRRPIQPSTPDPNVKVAQLETSFGDSAGAVKKFFRRRNSSNESGKINKSFGDGFAQIAGFFGEKLNQKCKVGIPNSFIKTEHLIKKIQRTPKTSMRTSPNHDPEITPPRINPKFFQQNQITINKNGNRKDSPNLSFEMRQKEMLILEDQNVRLRKQMKIQEQALNKLKESQKQQRQSIVKLQKQISMLKASLQKKQKDLNEQFKQNEQLKQQLKKSKNIQTVMQRQLDQLCSKKLSKDLKDVMSYRQISLLNQLQHLKQQLKITSSQKESNLENQLSELRAQTIGKSEECRSLQIANRILSKRADECEWQYQEYRDTIGKKYNTLRSNYKELMAEMDQVRKENAKLKRMRRGRVRQTSDDEVSLCLSASKD